jgi:cytochrome P450
MQNDLPVFRGKNPFLRGAEFLRNPYEFTIQHGPSLGDFYRVPFIFRKLFVTTNHEVIHHVLQKNQKNYVKSPAYRNLKQALGEGLVTSEGDHWRRQRRLAQPAFYKTQLEGLFNSMAGIAEQYCRDLAMKTQSGEPLELSKEMMSVTADIVLKTLFSADNPADISEMYRIMSEAQDYLVFITVNPHLVPIVYMNGRRRRFRSDIAWFDRHLHSIIEARRSDPNPSNDLLTMLLQAKDEETGESMSDKHLRDETLTLFAAGHETSATALTWAFYLLSKHPAVLAKLRSEVDQVLGDRTPAFDELRQLPYTLKVIQETMRLYPPGFAIGRQPVQDDEILGQKIPAGSIVFISIAALHRDARFWQRPHDFFPEHFDSELEKERPRLAYLPFGAGPRMCIGNHFALMEMQLLLAMLVRRFDFSLVENHPVEPEPLITLKPKHGVLMKISARAVPGHPNSAS